LGVAEVEVGVGGTDGLLDVGREVVESEWAISCHGDGRRTGSTGGIEVIDGLPVEAEALDADCNSWSARYSKELVEDGFLSDIAVAEWSSPETS
jgi:hypothetical protein